MKNVSSNFAVLASKLLLGDQVSHWLEKCGLAGWLSGWLAGCLAAWLSGWLAGCLAAWWAGWLVGCPDWCLPACLPGGWLAARNTSPQPDPKIDFSAPVLRLTSLCFGRPRISHNSAAAFLAGCLHCWAVWLAGLRGWLDVWLAGLAGWLPGCLAGGWLASNVIPK